MKSKTENHFVFIDQLQSPNPKAVGDPYGIIKDSEAAKRFGARNIIEYSYLAWRSCAVANLLSILKTENLYSGNLYELTQELLRIDGYAYKNFRGGSDIGWKHQSMIDISKKYGLFMRSYLVNSLKELTEKVAKSKYIIVSLQGLRSSHMVILREVDVEYARYSDPLVYKNSGGPKAKMKTELFLRKFNKRILLVT